MYIHETDSWPIFTWDRTRTDPKLAAINKATGYLDGILSAIGFDVKERAAVEAYTHDIVASSEIEGLLINSDQVRSSIARRMGIKITGEVPYGHYVEGIVEMMLDAVQGYDKPLTNDRLFGWHSCLFPGGRSGYEEINVGKYRVDEMSVISGALDREKVHYRAPSPDRVQKEMDVFLKWFNDPSTPRDYIKSAVAHFWFVSIHPFDDGNGRIGRAIADMALSQADNSPRRYFSMSRQIGQEKSIMTYWSAARKEPRTSQPGLSGIWIVCFEPSKGPKRCYRPFWTRRSFGRIIPKPISMSVSALSSTFFWTKTRASSLPSVGQNSQKFPRTRLYEMSNTLQR